MKKQSKQQKQEAWRNSPEGLRQYAATKEAAQKRADELGYDQGIEPNDVFKNWHTFGLPMRVHRRGFELACEVVHPSDLSKCKPGHGPLA